MRTRKVAITSVNSRDIRLDDDSDVLMMRPMRKMTHVSVVECPLSGQMTLVDRCARCERFIRISDDTENVSVECNA
jgi:hypothetical protein